ncbi:MAG: trypsin-like peptidase domain-containing protein [Myxococcales bacterium]|nr:trypsin-like peptidase domain-containing protein [Myxococcales bacterium]
MTREDEALDAYSRVVVHVADTVGPAVASVQISRRRRARYGADGAGSAFACTPDGTLVTNAHVVEGARHVEVRFPDGQDRRADVVGTDPQTDLALLRVEATGLPYLPVADPRPLRPGQLVVAIGNPYGFDATISAGVLSATDRTLAGAKQPLHHLLQHTAPINPGNSGGPLVDAEGHLMGVNVAMIASAQGIGFAVPAQTLSWVVPRLLQQGRVVRGFLGVSVVTDRGGARVLAVQRSSPAAAAGLQTGDLLVGLGGRRIITSDDLARWMAETPPGRAVTATVLRDSVRTEISVTPVAAR